MSSPVGEAERQSPESSTVLKGSERHIHEDSDPGHDSGRRGQVRATKRSHVVDPDVQGVRPCVLRIVNPDSLSPSRDDDQFSAKRSRVDQHVVNLDEEDEVEIVTHFVEEEEEDDDEEREAEASLDHPKKAEIVPNEHEKSKEEGDDTDAELEAIKARVKEMEEEAAKLREMQAEVDTTLQKSPAFESGSFRVSRSSSVSPNKPGMVGLAEKAAVDGRSVYVGNVDYGATAEELEQHFRGCGVINRVTIVCNHDSGRPLGFAYMEFDCRDSAVTAMALDESLFRGRQIKVLPKRTNIPGVTIPRAGGKCASHPRGYHRGGFRGGRRPWYRGGFFTYY